MNVLGWIQVVLGLLAIGSGAIVLRGVLRVALNGSRVIRFLEYSLIASVAGLLPITGHLSPTQGICLHGASSTLLAGGARSSLSSLWLFSI
jgi:hypothetical protein